jgi:hypothetical protein
VKELETKTITTAAMLAVIDQTWEQLIAALDDLGRTCKTSLGEMSLGEFLITCYVFHIGDRHIAQMDDFL